MRRLFAGSVSDRRAADETTKCPESLCPMSKLIFIGETCLVSCEDITPRSSLLRTHAPIPSDSPPTSALASFVESSQVATSPCCHRDLPDVISASPSEDAWALTTTVCRLHLPVTSPATLAFPRKGSGSAYREYPLKRLLSGANLRSCSHFVMFRPLRLLATLVAHHLHCFQ
jgi:hypothetical protein